ncbi:MAG: GNAT family N-acetyltransferase [Pontimonas sp.]
MALIIRDATPAEVSHLMEASTILLQSLYPEESNHLVDPTDLGAEGNVLLGAEDLDTLIGCVGYVDRSDYAEVKRLFVSQEFRGQGVARVLMAELESRAVDVGHSIMRLETGIHQPDAMTLFESLRYRIRLPFGDYVNDPLSVFMEKALV